MASSRRRLLLPNLVYTKLAELDKKEKQIVNIFGIVKFFKSPCKSRGRDFCLTLSLVDDSFQSTEKSFVCNIFCPHENELPLIKSVGDIVRLDGIRVSRFRGELQGKGTSSLSWVTFDGYSSEPNNCTASSIPNYTINDQDKQILHDLKAWQSSFESIQPEFYKKTFSQILPDVVFFNIACQVVSVCQAVNCNCVILTIWDGTVLSCQSYSLEEPLTSALMADESIKQDANGMTIDVFLYDEHATGEVKNVQPGDFVLLSNVHAKPENAVSKEGCLPIISFVIHKGRVNGRGLFKLPQDSQFVKELQQQITLFKTNKQTKPSAIQKQESLTRTLQTSCTVTDFPLVPFTTIENIKKCSNIPNKFRCRVKALAFLPNNVRNFVQLCCQQCRQVVLNKEPKTDDNCKRKFCQDEFESMDSKSESSQDEQENYPESCPECSLPNLEVKQCSVCEQVMSLVYVFSLLLEDTTGLLHVMLFDQDARHFLPELPTAKEFLVQPETQNGIRDTLISVTDNLANELNSESQPFSERPWMECCVISYQVQGQGVLYRMFGTSMV